GPRRGPPGPPGGRRHPAAGRQPPRQQAQARPPARQPLPRPGARRGRRRGGAARPPAGAPAAGRPAPLLRAPPPRPPPPHRPTPPGPQRFGQDGGPAASGFALPRGGPPPAPPGGRRPNARSPFLRKLALSAAQSALFNHYLARRLHDGLLRRVLAGDVMARWPHGGLFVAAEVEQEQARFDARETVSAGPIFGRKTFPAAGEAAAREAAVLAAAG